MLKTLFLFAGLVAFGHCMIQCTPDICSKLKCSVDVDKAVCESKGGKHYPKGGWCGCCSSCVDQLEEGENCMHTLLIGAPKVAECKDDLYCHIESRRCRKPTCQMQYQKQNARLEEAKRQGHPLLGLTLPNCVDDGSYHPKQCQGSKCFCVEADGKAIEGFDANRWEADEMNCRCARDLAEYKKLGIVGKMFFCEGNGNYKEVQCTGSVCYCVDELGRQRMELESVHVSVIDKLNC